MDAASRHSLFGNRPTTAISNVGVNGDHDGNSSATSSSSSNLGVVSCGGTSGFGLFCLGGGGGGVASSTRRPYLPSFTEVGGLGRRQRQTKPLESSFNAGAFPPQESKIDDTIFKRSSSSPSSSQQQIPSSSSTTRITSTTKKLPLSSDEVQVDEHMEVVVKDEDPSILLAQELSQLSYHERNQLMEEIHGVVEDAQHCHPTTTYHQPGPNEYHRNHASPSTSTRRDLEDNPHYINECIERMKQMIKNLQQNDTTTTTTTTTHKVGGGGGGKQQGRGVRNDNRDTTTTKSSKTFFDAYNRACFLAPRKYQDNRAFLLMFLRSTSFDIKSAVYKMIEYFNYKVKLFGWEKVAKDITLDDLDDDDMEALKSGASVFLPYSDTAGRAVCLTVMKHVVAKKWENQVCLSVSEFFLVACVVPRPLFCFPCYLI